MSDSDVMQREQAIFDLARQIKSPEVRSAYLSQACQGDSDLESRVAKFLSIYEAEDSLLDQPPGGLGATIDLPQVEQEGQAVGPYQLLQKIGEGGFGIVYMAEQTEPIRRKVALKIIKPGMDSKEVIARFEAERQALAMMSHPNIASVLDGGCTPNGRPYFVMELVRGVSLTEYCDKKRLRPFERLKLFMDVCSAIQHAHQKGIIHRDIKPSNVMVTPHDGTPIVKVIDFGVAKAINQQLTEKMYFTRYGQMIGTPQYMSPEQAEMSGLGVDTLSDIYSLGVLLYELLVGTTPLKEDDLRQAGYKEMQRLICEEETARPSNRLSTTGQQQLLDIAEHRGVTPEMLASEISGDLEWIVMKTLEKERDRRYATPLDLSRDLQRCLDDQPVEARPPSIRYRLTKYVRRHRVPIAAAVAISLVLVLATGFSTSMWITAQSAKKAAEERLHDLKGEQKKTKQSLVKAERLTEMVSRQNQQLEGQLYRTLVQTASDLERSFARDEARKVLNSSPINQRDWEYERLNYLIDNNRVCINGSAVPLFAGSNDRLVTIAGVGHPTSVCVWNPESGEQLDEIPLEAESELRMSALHPNNQLVLTSDETGNLYLVDIVSRSTVFSIDHAHDGRVDGLGFSPDGRHFASSSTSGKLKLWSVETGTLIRENDAGEPLRAAEFDPTGRFIATAGRPREDLEAFSVRVWDSRTLELIREINLNGKRCRTVAFSPSGDRLAVGGGWGSSILSTQTWEVQNEFPDHPGAVFSVRFRPDGKVLVASGKGTARFWDIASGRMLKEIATSLDEIYWTNFSPDQKSFVIYGWGQTQGMFVERLDAAAESSSKQVVALDGLRDQWVNQGVFSPDGKRFSATGTDRSIMIWDTSTRMVKQHLHGHRSSVGELEWARDGRLFSFDAGGYVRAWDLNSGLEWEKHFDENVKLNSLNTMAIHPDSKRLFVGTSNSGIVVADAASGIEKDRIVFQRAVTALACSPDGKWLAFSNTLSEVQLYDADSLECVGSIQVPGGVIRKIAFSPDSSDIAVVSRFAILVSNVKTRKKRWSRNNGDGFGLVFSNSGRRLITSSLGMIRVLDIKDGTLVYAWPAASCFDIAIDSENQTVAAFGGDGTVRLYPTSEHLELGTESTVVKPLPTDAAVGLSPYQMQMESRRILIEREQQDYSRALELAIAATEEVADCAEYEFTKGLAFFRQNDYEQANSVLAKVESMKWNRMIWLDPSTPTKLKTYLHAVRAMALHKVHQPELAEEQLKIAKEILTPEDEIGLDIIKEAEQTIAGS